MQCRQDVVLTHSRPCRVPPDDPLAFVVVAIGQAQLQRQHRRHPAQGEDAPQKPQQNAVEPIELRVQPVRPVLHGFVFGAGTRGGAPVVVALDARGDAALAPINPDRGTIGIKERLRPLSEATLGSAPACAPRPDDARIVLPFEGAIAVDRGGLPGVSPSLGTGIAVLRWSRERACLDAVEVPVHDDRFDENPGPYEPHGVLRRIVARFGARARPCCSWSATGRSCDSGSRAPRCSRGRERGREGLPRGGLKLAAPVFRCRMQLSSEDSALV